MELERCVCLTGATAHLAGPEDVKAICGTWPILRLSRMGDWQAMWHEAAAAYELCGSCAAIAGDDSA